MGLAELRLQHGPDVEKSSWSKRFSRVWPLIWPAGVTLPAQIVALWLYAQAHHFQRVTDFVFVGRFFSQHLGIAQLATSEYGYDGQFYYYMARFPFHAPPGSFDLAPERYSRMLYPTLARVVSLGHVSLMPWAMLGINLAAITGMVLLLSWLLRERGLPAWPALVAGFYCGLSLGTLRDLADPQVGFWLALALVFMQRRRWLLTAGAVAFGLLTRETMLPFALCFAVPLLLEHRSEARQFKSAATSAAPAKSGTLAAARDRRWLMLAGYFLIAFGPYAAWQVYLHQWLGVWPLQASLADPSNKLTHRPFIGLAAAPDLHTLMQFIVFACIPAVAGIIGGLLTLWERPSGKGRVRELGSRTLVPSGHSRVPPWRDAPRLAAALGALVYGVAFALQPSAHWLDIWAPMRLAVPFAVLLPLLLPRAPGWRRSAWLAVLSLMIFSFTLALAPV